MSASFPRCHNRMLVWNSDETYIRFGLPRALLFNLLNELLSLRTLLVLHPKGLKLGQHELMSVAGPRPESRMTLRRMCRAHLVIFGLRTHGGQWVLIEPIVTPYEWRSLDQCDMKEQIDFEF